MDFNKRASGKVAIIDSTRYSTAIFPFFDAVLFSLLIPFIVYDCYKTFFKQVTELMFCYEYTYCVNEYNYSHNECHQFCHEYSLS